MPHRPLPASAVRTVIAALTLPALGISALAVAPTAVAASDPSAATTWRVYKTIAVSNTTLNDVVALPGGTAWAGGQTPTPGPLMYHFAGGRWHAVRLPGPVGSFVAHVAGTSATNVWATIGNEDAAAHRTSRGWSTTSFGPTPLSMVGGVVTTGPKNTWVFTSNLASSEGFAHHYNGSAWKSTRLPAAATSGSQAEAASASSARNIWTWAYNAATRKYETMRYNGIRWQVFGVPTHLAPAGQAIKPQSMLAVSASDVWATAYTTSLGVAGPVILLHWQGHGWAKVTGTRPAGALLGPIARDGRGGIWLGAVSQSSSPMILHYLNGTWTTYHVPSDPAGVISLNGLSLVPGTRALWGVGVLGRTALGSTKGAVIVKYGQ